MGAAPEKRLSGNVLDPASLLRQENLLLLEKEFSGVFAFLAFHPAADRSVTQYLEDGTLASDSGPNLLVLFTQSRAVGTPETVEAASFAGWLTLEQEDLPAQRLVRELFEPKPIPLLPGLLVFERFTFPAEALYFELAQADGAETLRDALRSIFTLVDHAARSRGNSGRSFVDLAVVAAQKARLPAQRSGPVSMRQWLVKGYQFVGDHSGDIVAAAGLVPLA